MIRQGFIEQEVLHEIAMSIGESIEQEKMLAECIPVFLRSLGCATAAVLLQDEDVSFYTPSYILPRAAVRNQLLHQAINQTIECLSSGQTLPFPLVYFEENELYYYAWPIKNLGALLLGRSTSLREGLYREIQPLANKLALALSSCRQYDRLKLAQKSLISARDEAQAANKAKSRFLATMSHEIRTPLNAVINLSELLKESPLDEQQFKLAQGICEGGRSLLQLVNDVLDFSRIEAGRMELVSTSFRLHDLLDGLVSLFEKEAKAKKLHFGLTVSDDVPDFIVADLSRLRQILQNLLVNAIKFTDSGSVSIAVSTYEQDQQGNAIQPVAGSSSELMPMLVFYVSDTGIGISAQDQQRLFHEFTQVDTNLDRRFGGSGLGLAIAGRLVRLMGGSIGCHSVLNVGSTFWFTLPVKANVEPVVMPVRTSQLNLDLQLLLVEDSMTNQMVAVAMLEKIGCHITLANDGFEALTLVQKEHFDMVLMDVSMPGMDGLEATRQIRALGESYADIPIIAMTAHAFAQDRDACMEAGMNDYLSKPLNREQLYALLQNWAGKLGKQNPKDVSPQNTQSTPLSQAAKTATSAASSHAMDPHHSVSTPQTESCQNAEAEILPGQALSIENSSMNQDVSDNAMTANLMMPLMSNLEEHAVLDEGILAALIRDTSPELLQRLIGIFLKESEEHLSALNECLLKSDFAAAAKRAHAVKSSSGALGAARLQFCCSELEKDCRSEMPDASAITALYRYTMDVAAQSWAALRAQ